MRLTAEEARVLGALVEKALATPQHYPLTLNAAVAACNQTTNRDPVVAYDARTVQRALARLRDAGLVRYVHRPGERSTKHEHRAGEVLGVGRQELALLCVLLLRGPQTPGELRARSERLAAFDGLDAVEATLERLATRPDDPLVVRLERAAGQKEVRYATLLTAYDGGTPAAAAVPRAAAPPAGDAEAGTHVGAAVSVADDVAALRREVAALRAEVAELRAAMAPRQLPDDA